MNNLTIRRLTLGACLAAISYLLMFVSFVVIPLVPFMKLDFSDLPILVAFCLLGTAGGVQVAFLRSLLYFIISGPSLPNLIGVSLSFLATLSFCLPLYYVLRRQKLTAKDKIIAVLIATLSLTLILSLVNWLVTIPLYMQLLGLKLSLPLPQMILYGVVPFNLIKGVVVGSLFLLLYAKLHPWMLEHQELR